MKCFLIKEERSWYWNINCSEYYKEVSSFVFIQISPFGVLWVGNLSGSCTEKSADKYDWHNMFLIGIKQVGMN